MRRMSVTRSAWGAGLSSAFLSPSRRNASIGVFTHALSAGLGYMARLEPEFAKRNTKIIGLSVDPVASHGRWAADIEETQGSKVTYPMIGDPELKVAKLYDMLPADAGDTSEGRTPATNATVRTVFVIGPDKKIKLMLR